MFTLIVRVKVKPEHIERYKQEIVADAIGSVRDEPGCLRFDVSIDNTDPTVLYFYEVYKDEAAFGEHLKAPHFIKYRDATKDMAESSTAYRATTLFPPDADWEKPRISG
jgi:autoinducer 2-degrading protein